LNTSTGGAFAEMEPKPNPRQWAISVLRSTRLATVQAPPLFASARVPVVGPSGAMVDGALRAGGSGGLRSAGARFR